MMTKNQALALEHGTRVKYGREIFTVDHRTNVGTHEEPVLIAESGRRLVGTLFIAHLLSFADRPQTHTAEPGSEFMDAGDDYLDDVTDEDSVEPGQTVPVEAVVTEAEVHQEAVTSVADTEASTAVETAMLEIPGINAEPEAPAQAVDSVLPNDGIPAEELALLKAFEADAEV